MTIAGEIRRHRLAAGVSAQQLSDACARHGAVIPRTVISNIENGRRTNISVSELLILARALGVPPVALIFPVGYVSEVEFLPEKESAPLEAVDWFAGEGLPPGVKETAWPPGTGSVQKWAVYLNRQHRDLVYKIFSLRRGAFEYQTMYPHEGDQAEEVLIARQRADVFVSHLSDLRKEMSRRGLLLPDIPDVISRQIEESQKAEFEFETPDASDDETGWTPNE